MIDRAVATLMTLNLKDIPALLVTLTSRTTHHARAAICSACLRPRTNPLLFCAKRVWVGLVRVATGDLRKLVSLCFFAGPRTPGEAAKNSTGAAAGNGRSELRETEYRCLLAKARFRMF